MKANFVFCTSRGWIGATHIYALPLAWQRGIGTEPPIFKILDLPLRYGQYGTHGIATGVIQRDGKIV